MQSVMPTTSLFLFIGVLILLRRIRSMQKPTKGKGKRILLPLLFLLPGFVFFLNPGHTTYFQIFVSIFLGIFLSILLIIFSDYEIRKDGLIYTKKSLAFIVTFSILIILRYYFRQHLASINSATLNMLIFLIVICYLVPWRIACYIKFKRILNLKNQSIRSA